MSTEQHEALKLADEIDSREWFSCAQAADTIRTQHALIVQMQSALKSARGTLNFHDLPAECIPVNEAIAAATQYLTRGPKP